MIYILLIIFQIMSHGTPFYVHQENAVATPKEVSIASEASVEQILEAVDQASQKLESTTQIYQ